MSRLQSRSGRRRTALVAAVLMLTIPSLAFLVSPRATADTASPGQNLAGISADASATGIQFIPLVTGVVPAGNLATGDFVQVSVPYSSSTSSTGPSNSTTATPVWPGSVASNLASALPQLGFPQQLGDLLADPVLAVADYPPEVSAGSSGSFSPPAGSATGALTADAQASDAGTKGTANLTDTPLAGGLISIGTSTASSSIDIGASSVSDTAHADLTHISILDGLIDIASISSNASTTSNGTTATETSDLEVGSVTVAGLEAAITANGLQLLGPPNQQTSLVLTLFNSALTALQAAGISITVLQPTDTVQGASATVNSGVVQIGLSDTSIPSLNGNIPVRSLGLDVDLGLTTADANTTLLPPLTPLPPATPSSSTSPISQPVGTIPSVGTGNGSGGGTSLVVQTSSGSRAPVLGATPPSGSTANRPTEQSSQVTATPAAFLGMPTRLAWVVIAVLLSIVACAPLLGYANWQLLRGRNP